MSFEVERSNPPSFAVAGLLAVGVFVAAVTWSMEHKSYDVWGGLLLAPFLLLLTAPLAMRVARREADPRIARLILIALALKLTASVVRYAVAFKLYDGVADARVYHDVGTQLAEQFRAGIYVADIGRIMGTGFIKIVTGVIYTFIGPTKIGGYLIFSWLGFWGLYLFYRAFCLACPGGDRLRYARLVMLLPSLLFWPSGIGKEAWMTLTLGLTAYAAARLYVRARGGFVLLGLGLLGTAMVRPHITVLILVALVIGYLVRPGTDRRSPLRPVVTVAGVAVLCVAGAIMLSQAQRYFGVDSFNSEAVGQVLDDTTVQTAQGGSAFRARSVSSPGQLPYAAITVLFRPFPHEADNAQALVSALEGSFLLCLFAVSWRRLARVPRLLAKQPYLAFAFAYALMFVFAFSSFANFGILTRQRVQLFPFALVFLAIPAGGLPRDNTAPSAGQLPELSTLGR